MAAAVVPVRVRRRIVHIERESTTDSGGIVRTRPGNQGKRENNRRCAPHNPFIYAKFFLKSVNVSLKLFCGGSVPHTPSRRLRRRRLLTRKAAAVVPARVRRRIVHTERESTTERGGIVRTRPGNQVASTAPTSVREICRCASATNLWNHAVFIAGHLADVTA